MHGLCITCSAIVLKSIVTCEIIVPGLLVVICVDVERNIFVDRMILKYSTIDNMNHVIYDSTIGAHYIIGSPGSMRDRPFVTAVPNSMSLGT